MLPLAGKGQARTPTALESDCSLLERIELSQSTKALLEFVHTDVIGENECFMGPFGVRKLTYLGNDLACLYAPAF